MKVGLDQEEIEAHEWAVAVFDALALLGKLAPERANRCKTCQHASAPFLRLR